MLIKVSLKSAFHSHKKSAERRPKTKKNNDFYTQKYVSKNYSALVLREWKTASNMQNTSKSYQSKSVLSYPLRFVSLSKSLLLWGLRICFSVGYHCYKHLGRKNSWWRLRKQKQLKYLPKFLGSKTPSSGNILEILQLVWMYIPACSLNMRIAQYQVLRSLFFFAHFTPTMVINFDTFNLWADWVSVYVNFDSSNVMSNFSVR